MLSDDAARGLNSFLQKNQLVLNREELIVYEIDAAQDRGAPDGVLIPQSIDEVQKIVQWARDRQIALIGRGAGTGLSGGCVAEQGGIIVEFSRLNHILDVDKVGRTALVEPGVINQELSEAVKQFSLYFPPDPASGSSSTLGGNVAENAGGPHCFKYGVTTTYLTGVECVLADGAIIHFGGRALDYPEYDFVHLLAGSEGTLGLITRASFRLLRYPPAVKTMMAAFASVAQAGIAVSAVIAAGLIPATIELMDQKMTRIIEAHAHAGLLTEAGAQLIIEVDGYPASLNIQMNEVSAILLENGGYELQVAHSDAERERIWYGRKCAAGALARLAPASLLLDGCVPRSFLAEILDATNHICEEYGLQVGYVLHAGDGNLHPYILMHPKNKEQVKRVYQAGEAFMRKVVSMEGSITGEHGVGIEKRIYMPFMFNQAELDAMQQVKHIFDPSNLMNPGKIFPQTTSESHTQKIHIKELPGNCSPESIQEAAQCLAFCSRAHQPVLISGGSRKSQRIEENYSLISTSKLTGIHKYAPNDLYVVAGAGIVLDDLQAYLKEKGKWIPIISPWASATLGGVMAANVNSPLRMLYGSLSDQVLSMSVVLGDGRILRTGRPVVKNDAGYDLTKLFVGSFGTLGLIADITCKVISLPRCRRSVFMPVENINDGLRYGQKCLHLALKASAITLTKGITLPWLTTSDLQASHWLTYTAEGMPEDVETETQFVLQALQNEGASKSFILEDVSGSQLWQSLLGDPSVNKINIRTGVPAKTIGPILQLLGPSLESASYLIDFANGFIYTASEKNSLPVAMDWCENLRQSAQRFGGYSLLMEAPGEWFRTLDRLRFREDIFRLMQKLKASWDPAGILSPWVLNQAVG